MCFAVDLLWASASSFYTEKTHGLTQIHCKSDDNCMTGKKETRKLISQFSRKKNLNPKEKSDDIPSGTS